MKNLRRLVDERDVPVVMVTHNLELAKRYADLILELGPGGAVCQAARRIMSLWELLRYSVSDLRHRWLTAALNIAAIGISVVYVLVLGFYAVNTHRYQQRVVEESGSGRKVVATVPNVSDDTQWFTRNGSTELRQTLGLRLAFPCVELNVDVSLDGRPTTGSRSRAPLRGDPTTSPARMAWGGPVSGPGTR